MNILISICARGNSKGLPDKNILPLNSVPLIGYSIKCARKLQKLWPNDKVDIELSTDSKKIISTALSCGLESDYIRPDELATDSSGKIPVLDDLLKFSEKKHHKTYDFLLDLDVSSPLRTVEDVQKAFKLILKTPDSLNIFSVNSAHKNPYFNMVELNKNGFAELCKRLPQDQVLSRQKAPEVFALNASFYIYRRKFFQDNQRSAITNKSLIYNMDHICFDIDSPIDFEFLTYLITNNKLDFKI